MQPNEQTKIFLRRAGLYALLYFYLMNVFYLDIGQNMTDKYFVPIFIPMMTILIAGQFASREIIFSRFHFVNLLTGLFWCMTFPLLYTWTYERPWFMSLICYDFVVGTAIFLLLTSLAVLLMTPGEGEKVLRKKFASAILAVLNFFFVLVPLVEIIYYCLYWHCLSPASLMALYLTNWHESIEFVRSVVGDIPAIIILSAVAFFIRAAYKSHKKNCERLSRCEKNFSRTAAAIFTFVGAIAALIFYVPQTSMAGLLKNVTDYVAETEKFSPNHSARFAKLEIDSSQTLAAKSPGTVIVVIGESASRNYMHAFTPSFPFENTVWLSSKLPDEEKISQPPNPEFFVKVNEDYKATPENTPNLEPTPGNFIVYKNAYSSWSQTVPVLQRALTEQSQYNAKEFYDSISIVDVAKKAGYKTFWFSNQGRYGEYDSATTLVAKTADVAEWTDDAFDHSDKDDIILMNFFDKLNPAENNFIVLHLMGSHIYYNSRYPRAFKKWVTADGTGMMTAMPAYANTILYTDFVLSKIFDYAVKNLNLQAMIYFSDHGENLEISHNPDVFSFDMVRIPMFVYLSPEYEKNFPERAQILSEHRTQYFTNDMIYDTVCGILNAPSKNYEARQDFSSANYGFNRDNLTTMLGQIKISEDKE